MHYMNLKTMCGKAVNVMYIQVYLLQHKMRWRSTFNSSHRQHRIDRHQVANILIASGMLL